MAIGGGPPHFASEGDESAHLYDNIMRRIPHFAEGNDSSSVTKPHLLPSGRWPPSYCGWWTRYPYHPYSHVVNDAWCNNDLLLIWKVVAVGGEVFWKSFLSLIRHRTPHLISHVAKMTENWGPLVNPYEMVTSNDFMNWGPSGKTFWNEFKWPKLQTVL